MTLKKKIMIIMIITAAQNNTIRTYYKKGRIDKTQENGKRVMKQ